MRASVSLPVLIILLASLVPAAYAKPGNGHGHGGPATASVEALELSGNASLVVVLNSTGGDATFGFHAHGDGLPETFSLATANGTASASFSGLSEEDDDVRLSLDAAAAWRVRSASCSAGAPGAIVLAENATTTCWFDVEKLATLTIHVNATGNATFAFAATGAGIPAAFEVAVTNGSGSTTLSTLVPGTNYTVEAAANVGWELVRDDCTATLVLAAGGAAHCWFEFGGETRFTVIVHAQGGDGTFAFAGEGDGVPARFNVTTTHGTGRATFLVDAGEDLSARIAVPDGWELASGSCEDVRAAEGGEATCAFTLEKRAAIHVKIRALGGDDTFTLRFTTNESTTSSRVATDGGLAWKNFSGLDADATYGLRLVVDDDWRVSRGACRSVELDPGQTLTCEFVVTKLGEAQGRVTNASTGHGLAGYTVYADLDDDGERDAREPADATNATGYYTIDALPLGDDVTLRVDLEGSVCTVASPSSGYRNVDVTAGSLATAQNFRLSCPTAPSDDDDDDDDGSGDGDARAGGGPGYWKNWRNHHSEAQLTAWVKSVHGASDWSMPDGYPPTADGLRAMIQDSEGHCMKDLGKEQCKALRGSVRELVARLNALVA